jgi:hypothetical protein
MSFTTYGNLKAACLLFSHRSDLGSDDLFQNFITLTESIINRELHCKELETVATTALTTNVRTMALPTGFRELKSFAIIISNASRELQFKAPDQMNIDSTSGIPTELTIAGDNIEFNRTPDSAYSTRFVYQASCTALTSANPTTTLLTAYPNLYFNGCMHFLNIYTQDEVEAQKYETKLVNEINGVNKKFKRQRTGPSPAMRTKASYLP